MVNIGLYNAYKHSYTHTFIYIHSSVANSYGRFFYAFIILFLHSEYVGTSLIITFMNISINRMQIHLRRTFKNVKTIFYHDFYAYLL